MKTHIITKDQLDEDNNYIGEVNLEDFDGNLVAKENLGAVKFKSLDIKGHIDFKKGSEIKTYYGIKAGRGIKAGWGISAGRGIKAGWGIKAGLGIKAGDGILAGLSIYAKTIECNYNIIAGTCNWKIPKDEEKQIKAKIIKGTVAFGTHIEPFEDEEINESINTFFIELKEFRDDLLKSIEDGSVDKWKVNTLDTFIYNLNNIKNKNDEKL
jgi:hypothetical protein